MYITPRARKLFVNFACYKSYKRPSASQWENKDDWQIGPEFLAVAAMTTWTMFSFRPSIEMTDFFRSDMIKSNRLVKIASVITFRYKKHSSFMLDTTISRLIFILNLCYYSLTWYNFIVYHKKTVLWKVCTFQSDSFATIKLKSEVKIWNI